MVEDELPFSIKLKDVNKGLENNGFRFLGLMKKFFQRFQVEVLLDFCGIEQYKGTNLQNK